MTSGPPAARGRDRRAAGRAPSPIPARVDGIDVLRGIAIVAMIAYHFAFDLRFFGAIRADFENGAFWLAARAAIVSAFLLLVGVSLVLASIANVPPARFWKRVGVVAGCAALASFGSAMVYPQTFIYFGILHCIAASSVLAQPFVRRPRVAVALGAVVIAAGLLVAHPAFDSRALSWIGFTTVKPPTQDFVPLFPWFGVVLAGIALGHALAARGFAPVAPLAAAPPSLRWMGRHSLAIYMLHQPLLMGALWLVLR